MPSYIRKEPRMRQPKSKVLLRLGTTASAGLHGERGRGAGVPHMEGSPAKLRNGGKYAEL